MPIESSEEIYSGIVAQALLSAHTLFDRIKVARKDMTKPAREYGDYEVTLDESNMPSGVKILKAS